MKPLAYPSKFSIATDVEGIFRLSGSAKRIKELQAIFDSPDRYGKGLDWTGYTVHDAANILRRYLNQLPQPIVPLDFYERCREPLRSHQAQAVGDLEAQEQNVGDFDLGLAIKTYQQLIKELPPLNRQLLLYILDLLSVFASKSDHNRMNATNLAAIFQPGMLSHPSHDMSPHEYRLSQNVLIFLIENQDHFLIGMSGTAADEKTVRDVQSGAPSPRKPPSNIAGTPQAGLGRSSSNASAGADSLRKYGGIRRNVSVSSKNSTGVPSPISSIPGSPHAGSNSGVGVQRSNTVPSKKSPGLPSSRFNRQTDSPTPNSATLLPGTNLTPTARTSSPGSRLGQTTSEGRSPSTTSSLTPTVENPSGLTTVDESQLHNPSKEKLLPTERLSLQPPSHDFTSPASPGTSAKERKVSTIFSKSPISDNDSKDTRQPNRLRKKRLASSSNPSAQSSTQSLPRGQDSPINQTFYTPMPTPSISAQNNNDPLSTFPASLSSSTGTPKPEAPPQVGDGIHEVNEDLTHPTNGPPLKPSNSPSLSVHSRTSVTDLSEADHIDDPNMKERKEKKKRPWRFSYSAKNNGESRTTLSASSQLGSNPVAENSSTSVGSSSKPRKSITYDSQQIVTETSALSNFQAISNDSMPSKDREIGGDRGMSQETSEGKKGPIGWLKAKVAHAREEKHEREAEKERAKLSARNDVEYSKSKQDLSADTHEGVQGQRSADARNVQRESDSTVRPSSGI